MKKEFLRKKYKEKRDNIKNKVTKDNLIYQKVINNKDILSSKTLLIYISINSEVDTIKIINYFLNTKNIAVPKIIDNDMFFCYVTNLNELTSGKYNIPEPTNENIVTDFDNAICIVPGICYDKENYRIGYGKGYYDRFLSKNKIKTIGLCYKECMIEKIDNDKYDYKIDEVITE
ncbi:MAG: 5-formyltetrahydrofolate cyclo-ligase [Firmicutes bacterium]|uniref:5-formyltetrahydrofolate cyclo-ligase n=1 Tax=Candidatus Onthocola sp. TaxID=3085646 RepID=UPI002420E62E|nr:5-formyltetrahydrofolate cyclo-ligase [Bacillota bacterium]